MEEKEDMGRQAKKRLDEDALLTWKMAAGAATGGSCMRPANRNTLCVLKYGAAGAAHGLKFAIDQAHFQARGSQRSHKKYSYVFRLTPKYSSILIKFSVIFYANGKPLKSPFDT